MGDRCWLQVTLHGQVKSMRQLAAIVRAFEQDGGFDASSRREILEEITTALAAGGNPEFEDNERNYANVSDVEDALQKAQVPYSVSHSDGGGYSGAMWSWTPADGKYEVSILTGGGGEVVEVSTLRDALASADPLGAITKLVEYAAKASGNHLPVFSIESEAVSRYLAKQEAARALQVAA